VLGFTEEDEREVSSTLYDRLQADDLWAWVHENGETPVSAYKDDEEIVAEVPNRGRAESILEDESEKEEICELKIPKISKVLNNNSEVMY
jgi:hypothetical protein